MAKILLILLCIALLFVAFGYDDNMRVIVDRFMAMF